MGWGVSQDGMRYFQDGMGYSSGWDGLKLSGVKLRIGKVLAQDGMGCSSGWDGDGIGVAQDGN